MPPPRHILLAVRIGEASRAPGATAAWLSRELKARVTVVHVATELRTASEVATGTGIPEEEVRRGMWAEARERALELGREVLEGLDFGVEVVEGEVADGVAEVARRLGADLIVAGSQGRGGLQAVFLGDTTREILRKAPCPVVVAPLRVAGD